MSVSINELAVSSPAFATGARLDDRFAREGGDVQPPLRVEGIPREAKELAIICHDPDAPLPYGFTHWLLYGVPPEVVEIPENKGDKMFRPGPNDFGTIGYGGPRPPIGHGNHHYYFWVYALDTIVTGELSRELFLSRYHSNVIEQNRIVGTYSR